MDEETNLNEEEETANEGVTEPETDDPETENVADWEKYDDRDPL